MTRASEQAIDILFSLTFIWFKHFLHNKFVYLCECEYEYNVSATYIVYTVPYGAVRLSFLFHSLDEAIILDTLFILWLENRINLL